MAKVASSKTWSAGVALTDNEIWQIQHGTVRITVSTAPADDDGLLLTTGEAVKIVGGKTVKHRAVNGDAVIIREAVE